MKVNYKQIPVMEQIVIWSGMSLLRMQYELIQDLLGEK